MADRRSPEAERYRRWYNLARWKHPQYGVRARQLAEHPICQRCEARDEIVPATEVHHNPPHRGDEQRFWHGPFESLCKPCHDIDARQEEQRGYSRAIGADGYPIDPKHPANRQ